MTFEEAFDYLRSLSGMKEDAIRNLLNERIQEPGTEFIVVDEDSGTSFKVLYTEADGYSVEAIF